MSAETFDRPYVISWNLTYRCNLSCEHCYLDAGPKKNRLLHTENFSDRSELTTAECFKVIDEIASFAPECITILTGGEPLLRRDIVEIVRYANSKMLWVVVGTNGVTITETLAQILKAEGVRGFALSLDALDAERHDKFRVVKGAWENTVKGAKILNSTGFPFIIQTTVGKHNVDDLERIAAFARDDLGAKVWNLYFLVQTGRGQFVSDISAAEYENVLRCLHAIQKRYLTSMKVNAKCAPHYTRWLFEQDPDSPALKSFVGGAGGCPAGTHYLGIRPNGDVTPCPYLPLFGGNLKRTSLGEIWSSSELFTRIRARSSLKDRCGACEFNAACGGCRARAYGVSGDILAEDPLCSYQPGKYSPELIRIGGAEYGHLASLTIEWEPEAQQRMQLIPAFVRGMVIKRVEEYCRKESITVVTVQALEGIRARMPGPRVFGN